MLNEINQSKKIFEKKKKDGKLLYFIALHRYCGSYKLNICATLHQASLGAIFLVAFACVLSHILVILEIFQTFSLFYLL